MKPDLMHVTLHHASTRPHVFLILTPTIVCVLLVCLDGTVKRLLIIVITINVTMVGHAPMVDTRQAVCVPRGILGYSVTWILMNVHRTHVNMADGA